ncbi:MAG: NUMOD3 domain-containing DNA-binding protein [Bacilli bacterium]
MKYNSEILDKYNLHNCVKNIINNSKFIDGDYHVYLHISPNEKFYVGITMQEPEKRWKNGKSYYYNLHFKRSIDKYGWESFRHYILLSDISKQLAEEIEIELIRVLRSNDDHYGFNISNGGFSNGKHSEQTRKKLSQSLKGKPSPMKGKHLSLETKEKISKANSGRVVSRELREHLSIVMKGREKSSTTCQRLSDSLTGRKLSESHKQHMREANVGKTVPPEVKEKMSRSKKGKRLGSENTLSKGVICVNTGTHYGSVGEAQRKTGVAIASISKCCLGQIKSAGKSSLGEKLVWIYEDDPRLKSQNLDELKSILLLSSQSKKHPASRRVINKVTGAIYDSISDAARSINVDVQNISLCCHNKRNSSGKSDDGIPFIWEFYD